MNDLVTIEPSPLDSVPASGLRVTAIINGQTFEKTISSRRVQLSGEVLITGSAEGVSDTIARIFDMAATMRADIHEAMS